MASPMSVRETAWWYGRHALTIPHIQPTYSYMQVPKQHREPYIHTGFRPVHKPWRYYLASLFQIHNETVNVWSHLLAVPIHCYAIWWCFRDLDPLDSATWGLLLLGFSLATNTLLSALAHLFNSQSILAHLIFFSIDYVGIGVYGYGMGTLLYFTSGSQLFHSYFPASLFLPINFLLNINIFVSLTLAKVCYDHRPGPYNLMAGGARRKAFFVGAILASQLFMSIPIWIRLYELLTLDHPGPLSTLPLIGNHFLCIALDALCGFFFSSHLPERACVGGYDIVGHSHQIFHIVDIFLGLAQIKAAYADLQAQSRHVLAPVQPCFLNTFGGYLVFLSCGLLFVFLMRNRMRQRALLRKEEKNA